MPAGHYEYELLWTHPGEPGPYAHATGVATKVDGTPDQYVPGIDPVPPTGLPPITGLYVEARSEAPGGDPLVPDTYVIRLPYPPADTLSQFGIRAKGSPFVYVPVALQFRNATWEANISALRLTPGVYEFAYNFFSASNGAFTGQALGEVTVQLDGSISIVDTTPPYDPGSPGVPGYTIPGIPNAYGDYTTAPSSPYAISQDPLLGGLLLNASFGLNGSSAYQRPVVEQSVDRCGT